MKRKENAALPDVMEGRDGIQPKSKNPEKEPVCIPYSYLGEIQMGFLFTKIAVGFTFISLVISIVALLGK